MAGRSESPKRNEANFLDLHRETILGWMGEGMKQSVILERLRDDHQVECSKGTLSEYISKNELRDEVIRRKVPHTAQEDDTPPLPSESRPPIGVGLTSEQANATDTAAPESSPPTATPIKTVEEPRPPVQTPPQVAPVAPTEPPPLPPKQLRPVAPQPLPVPPLPPPIPPPIPPPTPARAVEPTPPPPLAPSAPSKPGPPPPQPLPTPPPSGLSPALEERLRQKGPPERERWTPPPLPFVIEPSRPIWEPLIPLLQFGPNGENAWTIQDACEGTFIVGATGSGKTTGSGRVLAETFLQAGFGGLVLTVKPEERQMWENLARQNGRSHHVCVVEPRGRFRFNFLDYESRRPGAVDGGIEEIVNLFGTILRGQGGEGEGVSNAAFWTNAQKQLLRNALRILGAARSRLTLTDILEFINQAPTSKDIVESGVWRNTALFGPALEEAMRMTPEKKDLERSLNDAYRYWLGEYANLATSTRSSIVVGLTATASRLFAPGIFDLICADTTIIPEAVLDGALIIVDLPIKTYDTVGHFIQMVWKYVFQKAVERRADPHGPTRRPVFLWADEAQYFLSEYDSLFQSTARSSRAATVYLTQNIPNFVVAMPSRGAMQRVQGLVGNLNTKIFHANADTSTNQWASSQIGQTWKHRADFSINTEDSNPLDIWGAIFPKAKQTVNGKQSYEFEVPPESFARLRTGGRAWQGLIDAYFVKSGARFYPDGKHFFLTVFQQEL